MDRAFSVLLATVAALVALGPASGPAIARAQAPVDLLHATRADVAVSSVYRDRDHQAALLVDGDPETAWNSRTGDLVGAWIEIRLPADAQVTGIALTAGFTHRTERADLFTGNHRVSRVRVSRDGQVLGEHALDTSARDLQTLPVRGGGGVYRIEVVAVEPGSRSDWRETCISELRVLGTARGMRAGERSPRVASGALPAPRPEPGSVDPVGLAGRARDAIAAFARTWPRFEDEQRGEAATSEGPRAAADVPLGTYRQTRRTALTRIAELADLADEAPADQLRAAASREAEWGARGWTGAMQDGDLALVDAAIDAVIARAGDDVVRCEWSRAHAAILLQRVAWSLENRNYYWEMTWGYDEGQMTAADRRESREVERAWQRFQPLAGRGRRDPTRIASDLASFTLPASLPQDDFTALRAEVDAAAQTCGR